MERLQSARAEPTYPLGDSPEADPKGRGDDARSLTFDNHPSGDRGSTMQRGAGILVDVHSAYLRRN